MTTQWSGRRVQHARSIVAAWLPMPCGRCGEPVEPGSEWVVGHKVDRAIDPTLTWVVSNWRPEHRACSDRTGQAAVIDKARTEGVSAVLELLDSTDLAESVRAALADAEGALFPATEVGGKPPPLPVSLPSGPRTTRHAPIEPRSELAWSPDTLRGHPWLADLADVPEDAAPPLWMSPPPAAAVCSYAWSGCTHHPSGTNAIEWIEQVEGKTLRWWQRLAITRQLEHDHDGALVHTEVLESASRRSGKSMRMRGVALWRMEFGRLLFGETQTVVHTGSDIPICREIQRGAWRWAEGRWGTKSVTKANGKECIESATGDRWLVRSQDGVYGYDVTLGLGDECWNVKPDTISEGLEPATLERPSAQVHLTSTAHRRATSLMRGKLSTALVVDAPTSLLLVWGAPLGSDPADPDVWRAASPHWSQARHKLMADKHEKAAAGEVDPQADDPDPMEGFKAQYLNMWRLVGRREAPGTPLVTEEEWETRIALPDERTPDVAAIESWYSAGVSLALAWREETAALVVVTGHKDLAEAVAALRRSGYRGRVTVGSSLAKDPALAKIRTTPTKSTTAAAVQQLDRLLGEHALHHDGGPHLTDQVLALRTQPGVEGLRVVSKDRADAIKAAAWAATAARAKRTTGRRILTA